MRGHSTFVPRGRQGTPGRARLPCSAALAVCLLLLAGACSEAGQTGSVPPSTVDDAFRAAHPGGALPPGLKRGDGASRAAALLAGRDSAGRILLPAWLPSAYGLAVPYVSVGSGAVLPNPQVWDGGYRVSYTDGHGLIVLHVGSGRLPGGGMWRPLAFRWRGVTLWIRAAGGVTAVAARGRRRPVAVAATGVTRETAVDVLSSVRTLE